MKCSYCSWNLYADEILPEFHGVKFLRFSWICLTHEIFNPRKLLIRSILYWSMKIKLRKLSRMSFHENFTPQDFLAIRYYLGLLKVVQSSSHFHNPAITKPNTVQCVAIYSGYACGYWGLAMTIKHDHLPDFSVMQSGGVGNLQFHSMIPQTLLQLLQRGHLQWLRRWCVSSLFNNIAGTPTSIASQAGPNQLQRRSLSVSCTGRPNQLQCGSLSVSCTEKEGPGDFQ